MAHGVACPFCGFKRDNEYAIQLHIEEHHTKDSPFTVINAAPELPPRPHSKAVRIPDAPAETDWTKCTRPGCGEFISVADIQEHLDLHEAIDASEEDAEGARSAGRRGDAPGETPKGGSGMKTQLSRFVRDDGSGDGASSGGSSRNSGRSQQRSRWEGRSNGSSASTAASKKSGSSHGRSLLDYLSGNSHHGRPPLPSRPPRRIEQPREPGRLGPKELGPHAFENRMPAEVRRQLLNDALPRQTNRIGRDGRIVKQSSIGNETSGLIPVLADLCARSRTTEAAYFSHPSVRHVHKIRCEGNFCGYWNIQMLSFFLMDSARKDGIVPNVLEIQDTIEQAWDNGICAYSRIETGGIRGTRKWIGTHDALAYFTQTGVKVQALSFKDEDGDQPAILSLLDHLEAYFLSGLDSAEIRGSSHITQLPPVYFQRAGHSMTIVGLERKKDGHRNLIIFDPSFGTTRSMDLALDRKRTNAEPHSLLEPYRRNDESLSRWEEFEILVFVLSLHVNDIWVAVLTHRRPQPKSSGAHA